MKLDEIRETGARLLAVANDEPDRLRKFEKANEIGYPILLDPGGEVIERYGIRNREHVEGVIPDPTSLVVDREGVVRWKRVDPDYTVRPPVEELVRALKSCCSEPSTDR